MANALTKIPTLPPIPLTPGWWFRPAHCGGWGQVTGTDALSIAVSLLPGERLVKVDRPAPAERGQE